MILWLKEPQRHTAVIADDSHSSFAILGAGATVFTERGNRYIRVQRPLLSKSQDPLSHGLCLSYENPSTCQTAKVYVSIYDNGYDRFAKYEWEDRPITAGGSIEDDLYLQDPGIQPHQFVIDRRNHLVYDRFSSELAELDGKTLHQAAFRNGSCLRFLNVQILFNDRFISVCSPDNLYVLLKPWKRMEEKGREFPRPRSVTRRLRPFPSSRQFHTTLREPLPYEPHERNPLIFMMGPALTMSSAAMAAGVLNAYNGWMNGREFLQLLPSVLLPGVMIISTVLWNPLQRLCEKRRDRSRKKERETDYKKYLSELKESIMQFEAGVIADTEAVYSGNDVYCALRKDPDYGTLMLGYGEVPFDIELSSTVRFHPGDPIPDWIEGILAETGCQRMPVCLSLLKERRIAISFETRYKSTLCAYLFQMLGRSGPDLMKLVVLCTMEWIQSHPWVRDIPHVFLNAGERLIACGVHEAHEVLMSMHQNPQFDYLILGLNENLIRIFDDIDAHVVCLYENEPLPADFDLHVVLAESGSYFDNGTVQIFEPLNEEADPWHMVRYLRNNEVSELGEIGPQSPSLFDLFGNDSIRSYLERNWQENRTRDSICALIGVTEDARPLTLDLHERVHGPHGLIAGMTGSGKSELIITMLLSLCVRYSPQELQFVMIDFKGGGAAQLFANAAYRIPHVAGVLSNLDISGMERALVSFQSECHRREHLFKQLSDACGRPIMNLSGYQSAWQKDCGLPYLATLIIIVDEFAELKKERPDFMRDLISIARVGRSLGMHMILSTQKPSGIVDEQIWSNSRFKICLKVQEIQDSREMIHAAEAAYIHNPGEFYFLSDGLTVHGYSGYANAPAGGSSAAIQILSHRFAVIREKRLRAVSGTTQAMLAIQAVLDAGKEGPSASPLWLDPIECVKRGDLPQKHGIWLGRLDDFHTRTQPFLDWCEGNLAVFSLDRIEKIAFLYSLLAGILSVCGKKDEIYVIDDLNGLSGSLPVCSNLCGVFPSSDEERTGNLLDHLARGGREKGGLAYLLITNVSSFYDAHDAYKSRLHTLLEQGERLGIRMALFLSVSGSLSYRDMALIPMRIALKNENEQDLSAIFERPVHRRVADSYKGLVLKDKLLELTFAQTSREELHEVIRQTAHRNGTEPVYVIPVLPERIGFKDYTGNGVGLGIDTEDYAWVDIRRDEKLIVLSTYEEEFYEFYELLKKYVRRVILMPEREESSSFFEDREGGILFMTLEHFQTLYVRTPKSCVLYVGSGFRDQYRFSANTRAQLKKNQGIFYRQGRNRLIQICEE